MFISFEGMDGCGKSTQVRLFIDYLENKKIPYVFVREPGGTSAGEKIREILLHSHEELNPRTELLLFLASRSQLVEEVIKPAIQSGKIVIADRFAHSSVAYQGAGRNLGVETVENLNNFATGMTYPDIVFLIDIPVEEAMKRLSQWSKDRIEKEGTDFWNKIRECYLDLAKKEKSFVVIDGTRDINEIHREIIAFFEKLYH